MYRITLIICFLLSILSAQASAVPNQNTQEHILPASLSVLEDESTELAIDDLLTEPWSSQFQPIGTNRYNAGYTQSAVWIRFTIRESSDAEPGDLLIILDFPHLFDVQAYAIDGNREISYLGRRGIQHGFTSQQRDPSRIVFELSSLENLSKTFYLRIRSESSMSIGVHVLTPDAFSEEIGQRRLSLGLFYGILVAMGLYNLFIYFVTRERVYSLYFFFLLSYGLYMLSFDGLSYVFLSNTNIDFIQLMRYANKLAMLGFALALLFMRDYLVLNTKAPDLDKIYRVVSVAIFICIAIDFVINSARISNFMSNAIGAIVIFSMLIGSVNLLLKGYGPSRLFVCATLFAMAGGSLHVLRNVGLVPYHFLTRNAIHFGAVVQMILLSLGLGQRIKYLREEKEHALQQTRSKLASNLHDELGSTLTAISHFAGIIVADEKIKKSTQAQKFLPLIVESTSEARERVKDLIWSILPGEDDWTNLLANMKQYAANTFESMDISYTIDIPDDIPLRPMAMESRYHFWLVYKELLTNMAKHSQCQNALVRMDVSSKDIILTVADNGVGIDQEAKQAGLGLDSIKSRLSTLQAHYQLNTAPGEGTRWNIRMKP
ncbi:MAG: hypothetical protein JSU61_01650 [Fidelibacterota bacterium]|nr:MAG: hypothetical protein JSU61_01650 [Candidatus Neomarinimicrobiota bacterium]